MGSFANATATPTEVGFYWGTSSNPTSGKLVNTTSSSFSLNVTSLKSNTKYYYCTYVKVAGTGSYANDSKVIRGAEKSFTTPANTVEPAVSGKSWLELPGAVNNSNYLVNTYYSSTESDANRNYTHCYDKTTYTSLWTSYHLNSTHMGDYDRPSWRYNTVIDKAYQVDLREHSYNDNYSKGHLIPNASRDGNEEMQRQTFFVTNSVPQIQDKFNGGIWQSLESALQNIAKTEEIYVVTGVTFNKVGESETVKYTTAKDDTKQIPVPNYFYKVVLKVEKSGSTVTSASAIGFWFEHKDYEKGDNYANYAVSVDQIEQWTGFDFFVNVPDDLENAAEGNEDWSVFHDF